MAAGASVQLLDLRKTYGDVVALDALSLDIKQGEFVTLILSMFITGPTAVTLPKLMWDAVRLEIDPTIAAASSLLIAVAVIVLGTMEALRRKSAVRVPVS